MATEKHKEYSSFIKSIHSSLRKSANQIGADLAWSQHINHINDLRQYSEAMNNLSECWQTNLSANESCNDRTKWSINYCMKYFDKTTNILNHQRERERKILETIQGDLSDDINSTEFSFNVEHLKLLDVGSCNNPFKQYTNFEVTAIDIFPANDKVSKCDFLNVIINDDDDKNIDCNLNDPNFQTITELPKNYFDVIVFSLFLEYLPSSDQRKSCCVKAYNLLKFEGILLIITPDSKHIGANVKLMKNWQYTLALLGFSRIKYEKFKHITCMAFRKAIDNSVTMRWADIHKKPEMTNDLFIPQDFHSETIESNYENAPCDNECSTLSSVENLEYLLELPKLNDID